MQAGILAEVMIKTGERTVLAYLLHPLLKRMAASMKEERDQLQTHIHHFRSEF